MRESQGRAFLPLRPRFRSHRASLQIYPVCHWVVIPSSRGSSWPRSPVLQADSSLSKPRGKPSSLTEQVLYALPVSRGGEVLFTSSWSSSSKVLQEHGALEILLSMVKKENILMLLNFNWWNLFSEKRPWSIVTLVDLHFPVLGMCSQMSSETN